MAKKEVKPFQFTQLKREDIKKAAPKPSAPQRPVIRDDEKTAVALAYDPGDAAPKILATGKGAVAEKIIETAEENNVPTYRDNKLADTLSKLKIGDMIPPELYGVVAEILVFVDDMDRMKAKIEARR